MEQLNAMVEKIVGQVGTDGPCLLLQDRLQITILPTQAVEWIGSISIPASKGIFMPRRKFFLKSEEIEFFGLGVNFEREHLSEDVAEDPTQDHEIRYGNLIREVSSFDEILNELDGKVVATPMSDIYLLLREQAKGQDTGVLLTNGLSNVFLLRNKNEDHRVALVDYGAGGWNITSGNNGRGYKGIVGDRIFVITSS